MNSRYLKFLAKLALACCFVILLVSFINMSPNLNQEHVNEDEFTVTQDNYADDGTGLSLQLFEDKLYTQQQKQPNLLGQVTKEQNRDVKVDEMINRLRSEEFFPLSFWNTSFTELVQTLGSTAKKKARNLSAFSNTKPHGDLPAWKLLHRNIRQFSLYDPHDPNINIVLDEISKLPIIALETSDDWKDGTQLKMVFKFKNHEKALAKPMRYRREIGTNENQYIFDDMERHIAEIAAFNLDRLLGFCRVPPTIGRRVNITSELIPIAPRSLNKTFFYSPARNLCFYGHCKQFCGHAHAFCGHPDMIEFAVQAFLPSEDIARRKSWKQPWKRAYSRHRKAYCTESG